MAGCPLVYLIKQIKDKSKYIVKYTWVVVNIPGRPTEVKSMCGKHWTTRKLGV